VATAALAVILPPLPAAAWSLWGLHEAPGFEGNLLAGYFNRGAEWTWPRFFDALGAALVWTATNFPVLPLLAVVLALPWIGLTWRRHLPALLLAAAVLPELRYPLAFKANIYYLYPALYGLALLCAAAVVAAVEAVRAGPARRLLIAVLGTAVILSSLFDVQDYLLFTHRLTGGFLPQVAAAEELARLRLPWEKAATDSPQLMYYAGGDPHAVLFAGTIDACFVERAGRFYRYLLFQVAPPESERRRLAALGYEPHDGGLLWRLSGQATPMSQQYPWVAAPAVPATHTCA
jgi:hypothetical protein